MVGGEIGGTRVEGDAGKSDGERLQPTMQVQLMLAT
jgi:hypothetical protein